MSRIAIASLLAVAALTFADPGSAEAQCSPGSLFCADIHFGDAIQLAPPTHHVLVRAGRPAPRRAQVVVVQPAPYAPPPPPVVYVQPAPPPPPVATVYVTQQPTTVAVAPVPPLERPRLGYGLHGHIGGVAADNAHMGGGTVAFRLRPQDGHFALDLSIGAYGGRDYNESDRVEVPLTADVLFFVNPDDQFQLYGVAGLGVSFAHTESGAYGSAVSSVGPRDNTYVGGQLGVGVELRLSPWFAINGDVRGFVRERVDQNPIPEFVNSDGQTTDTSGGAVFNAGATVYF